MRTQQHLHALEIVSGRAHGRAHTPPPAVDGPIGSPREELEAVVLRALHRDPCVVSFSGGRDSSAVLALATHVARKHGLPDPVPVSLRFPWSTRSDESAWQELVVDHLGLATWEQVTVPEGEMGVLGPVATTELRRRGLSFPANRHFHIPMVRRAEGGALLTGVDGDGLLGGWRWWRAWHALRRPGCCATARDAARVTQSLLPSAVLLRADASRARAEEAWLTPTASALLRTAAARDSAAEPRRWAARVAWYRDHRWSELVVASFDQFAADHGVRAHHPFADPRVLQSVTTLGHVAVHGRTALLEELVGDLLPEAVVRRRGKATFDDVLFDEPFRDWVSEWTGEGVDTELVDVAALRASWLSPQPHYGTALLAQQAWLATSREYEPPTMTLLGDLVGATLGNGSVCVDGDVSAGLVIPPDGCF